MDKYVVKFHPVDEATVVVEADCLGAAIDKAQREWRRATRPAIRNVVMPGDMEPGLMDKYIALRNARAALVL